MQKTVTVLYEEFQALKGDHDRYLQGIESTLEELQKKLDTITPGGSILIKDEGSWFVPNREQILTNEETRKKIEEIIADKDKKQSEQFHEIQDLKITVLKLKQTSLFERIFLWGRK